MSWLSEALNWTDRHSGAVQAVGTIVVAGAGFFSIWWQRRREEREAAMAERAVMETLAVRIFPYVEDYANRLTRLVNNQPIGEWGYPEALQAIEDKLYLFRSSAPHMIAMSAERVRVEHGFAVALAGGHYPFESPEAAAIRWRWGPLALAASAARNELETIVNLAASSWHLGKR